MNLNIQVLVRKRDVRCCVNVNIYEIKTTFFKTIPALYDVVVLILFQWVDFHEYALNLPLLCNSF